VRQNQQAWQTTPLLARLLPQDALCGVSTSSDPRVCAQVLISAEAIRPSLGRVLTFADDRGTWSP